MAANPGQDQIAKWKAAIAAKGAAGRRQRAKRATPQSRAGMIRVNVRPEQPAAARKEDQHDRAQDTVRG